MMTRILICITFSLLTLNAFSQSKMRTVDELINKSDPGWTFVKGWIDSAKNKVEILPVDTEKAKLALHQLQVTTRSPMGAIVYMTGGLLIDNGWIRILGSGCSKLSRTLPDWNKGKTFQEYGEAPSFLFIADDVIGGFYLLNGGGLGQDLGKVYYWAPDNLAYEPTNLTYTEFLLFCFDGNLDQFYKGRRWTKWKDEVSALPGDKVFNFYPPLWTKEGNDINKVSRKAVPIEEQYLLNLDMRRQLGVDKKGR